MDILIKDPNTGFDISLAEAIRRNIFDERTGEYTDKTGRKISIPDAVKFGILTVVGAPIVGTQTVIRIIKSKVVTDPKTQKPKEIEVFIDKNLNDFSSELTENLKPQCSVTVTSQESADLKSQTTLGMKTTNLEIPPQLINIIINDPTTGQTLTVKEAIESGVVAPEDLQEIVENTSQPHNLKVMDTFSISLEDDKSPSEKVRSRITVEPKYNVAIGRAHSLSPEREAKKVILQKLRKKIVKPKEALSKGIIDAETAEILDKKDNFRTPDGEILNLQEALECNKIDGSQGKIIDPQRGDILSINEAINRGILDPNGTNEILVPLNKSLSLPEIYAQGLIDSATNKIIHPETGAHLSIKDAVVCDIVDPLSLVSCSAGKKVTLRKALESGIISPDNRVETSEGFVDLKTAINEKIFDEVDVSTKEDNNKKKRSKKEKESKKGKNKQQSKDDRKNSERERYSDGNESTEDKEDIPPAGMTFQVALRRGLVNCDNKQIINPITKEVVPLTKAIESDFIMALPYPHCSDAIKLEDALENKLIDPDTCTMKHPKTGELIPISEAVETGLLIIKPMNLKAVTNVSATVTSIHTVTTKTIELLSGYILLDSTRVQNVKTGEIIPLDVAKQRGIVVDEKGSCNVTTLKDIKLSFSEALNKGLVDMNTGTYTDPSSGEKIAISDALIKGKISAVPQVETIETTADIPLKTTELNLAEAYEKIRDPNTGKYQDPNEPQKLLTFSEALEKEIIDPNSVIYDVEAQRPITVEQAVEKGLIDAKTGEVKDKKTGKLVNVKKAAEMGLIAVMGTIAAPVLLPVAAGAALVKKLKKKKEGAEEEEDFKEKKKEGGSAKEVLNVKEGNREPLMITKENVSKSGYTIIDNFLDKERSSLEKQMIPEKRTFADAIKQKKISPTTCRVTYLGQELPYTVQDGLSQNELNGFDIIEVLDKNHVALVEKFPLITLRPTETSSTQKVEDTDSSNLKTESKMYVAQKIIEKPLELTIESLETKKIQKEPVKVIENQQELLKAKLERLPLGDAIVQNKITPKICRVILNEKELPFTVQDGLNQNELSPLDTIEILEKNKIILVSEKPISILTISKQITPQKLATLGYYDLRRRCFLDPYTLDKITFQEFIYELGIFNPENILVRNLSDQKQPSYVTLDDALSIPLIDKNNGNMVDPKTGKKVPFFEAVKIKWIIDSKDKPQEKRKPLTLEEIMDSDVLDAKNVTVYDPKSGQNVPLLTALQMKVIDPKSVAIRDPKNMQVVPYYEAVDASIVDLTEETITDTATKKIMPFPEAFRSGYVLTIRRPVALRVAIERGLYENGKIRDDLTKQLVPIDEAIQRNIVDGNITEVKDTKSNALVPLNNAIKINLVDIEKGAIIDQKSRQIVPFDKACDKDLIRTRPITFNLLQAIILNYYSPRNGLILNPCSGEEVTLAKAIEYNLIDPKTTKIKDDNQNGKIIEIKEAIESGILNPEEGCLTAPNLSLDRAYAKGYILSTILPWSLQETLAQRVYDPKTGSFTVNNANITLQQAIMDKVVDADVLTIRKQSTGDIITLQEAIDDKLVDPIGGKVKDVITKGNINFYEAQDRGIIIPYRKEIPLPEAVFKGYYDPTTGEFTNITNKERLKTESAINRGYIDTTSTLVTINEDVYTFDQALTDGLIDPKDGVILTNIDTIPQEQNALDFTEAFERGLLVEVKTPLSLYEAILKNVYDSESHLFLDPRTGQDMTLIEAIEVNLIDPESVHVKDTKSGVWRKLGLIDAIHLGYIDGNTAYVNDYSQRETLKITLPEAFDLGILIDNRAAVSIQRAIHQGLYEETSCKIHDPATERKITLHEAVRKFIINPLLPCYFDKKNGKLLNLSETCRLGIIDRREGTFKDPIKSVTLTLTEALNVGLIIDIETANFSLYDIIEMGLYDETANVLIHPSTNKKFNLKDALSVELVNPLHSIIKNIKMNKYVLLPEALAQNIINEELNTYNLPNGNTINLLEAKNRGLIVTNKRYISIEEALKNNFYRPDSGKFIDPSTCTCFDLIQGIESGFLDPTTTALKDSTTNALKTIPLAISEGNIDVEKGRVLDSKSRKTYNFDKAFEKGLLITLDKPIEDFLKISNVKEPKQTRECTLDEAIKFELLNPKISLFKHSQNGKFVTVLDGIDTKLLDPEKMIIFDPQVKIKPNIVTYDQTIPIFLTEPLTFERALEMGYLDVTTGKFTEPKSNEILTLKESITLGCIDPDTALIKDTNKKKLVKLPEGFRRGLVDAEKGNVLDSATSKLHSLSFALDKGLLVTPKRSFTLIEAITYGFYNPTTGSFNDPFITTSIIDRKRLTLTDAITDNLIDPSSTVIKDTESGAILPLLNAIDAGIVDTTGGKILDKGEDKMLDLQRALEKGLILPAEERVSFSF